MKIRMNEAVRHAIKTGMPVVALESTIISHGMPYPQNVTTAMELELLIRQGEAIPATIGIIDGECVVGMTPQEIEEFGKRRDIVKVSRRDLPVIIAQNRWGATTVSATMILAKLAGIKVFVTGGIGGVHRNAQETFDISADLQELASTDVLVVCAGAKAILDLPLTLEYLETVGVPVLGYQTLEFPSFYTPYSGLNVDYSMNSAEEIAKVAFTKWEMGLKGGIVVANPIPKQDALDKNYVEALIQGALREADRRGIKGKDITPFLLSYLEQASQGKSLKANIALVKNNAVVGAAIARYLSYLQKGVSL